MDTSTFSLIGGQFTCGHHLGSGTCGHCYAGVDVFTGKAVAIKFEPDSLDHRLVEHEALVYEQLANCPFVPRLHWFGSDYDCDIIVMDLLGPSLDSLFTQSEQRLPIKTVLTFGINLLHALEAFHDCGYIHRDLKPANVLTDRDKNNDMLYLIDLGLAQAYLLPDGQHICSASRSFAVGTARFCSARAHGRRRQSRRDDIESLAYVLLYLAGAPLPWADMKTARDIYVAKMQTRPAQVCSGFPRAFSELLQHARHLEFAARPDYARLRSSFERELNAQDREIAVPVPPLLTEDVARPVWTREASSGRLVSFAGHACSSLSSPIRI